MTVALYTTSVSIQYKDSKVKVGIVIDPAPLLYITEIGPAGLGGIKVIVSFEV